MTIATTLFCSMLLACNSLDRIPISLGHDAPIVTNGNDAGETEPIVITTNGEVEGTDNTDNTDNSGNASGSDESVGNEDNTNTSDENPTDDTENEKDILLIYRRSNYAWGCEDRGYIIDTNGNLYEYNFSNEAVIGPSKADKDDPNSYENKAKEIIDNNTGTPFMDKETVEKIQKLGKNVCPDDEFDSKHEMCDYGQETIYFYNPDTKELIMCESEGDVRKTPHNKDAQKIADLYYKTIDSLFED